MGKKKYYPNNYEWIKSMPAEFFDSIEFEEFMDWKVHGFRLPSSVSCIIREENTKTGKITEYVYDKQSAAKKKVDSILKKMESEFVLCDHESVHHLYLKSINEPFEEGEDDQFHGTTAYY
tara:strand:+ start:16 stop:375 length:360 start_codon:yes stop_codon:yes gene_type:complete